MCRVYLKPRDKEPNGPIIYVDEKSQQEYMIQDGIKIYLKPGDNKPDATYVYLGRRGGRYLVSEEKINELIHNPKKHFHRVKPNIFPKYRATTGEKDIGDLWN